MTKYRKKPVVVDAFQWTGDKNQTEDPEWIIEAISKGDVFFYNKQMEIKALEGQMTAKQGDYIIKGVKGEFYPCKPDIFHKTYEKAGD